MSETDESIMALAQRNGGRLPKAIADEIVSDPMAEFMRLVNAPGQERPRLKALLAKKAPWEK